MRPIFYPFLLPLFLLLLPDTSFAEERLTRYVRPMVGTDFTGHTFPGAAYPFGMVQLGPDTGLKGWEVCSGYHYSHREIYGFSHTHLNGTGCEDYCDILVMPVTGYAVPVIGNEHYRSPFLHGNEQAEPGYYRVQLDRWNVTAELTVGRRVGMHRYTWPAGEAPQLILDLTHRNELLDAALEISGDRALSGFRRSKQWAQDKEFHFYIEFSEPITEYRIEQAQTHAGKRAAKILITFGKGSPNVVTARIGLSSVSAQNARMNLESEVTGWEFDKLRNRTENAWNSYLKKIRITTADPEEKKVFYTAMYHTGLAPNIYSDVNGEYRGMDRKIHRTDGYEQYTVFSLWDTYRALHPLFTIIERERTQDFLRSLLSIYEQSGKLPVWELAGNETNCMIGYHAVSVIADAWSKGIRGVDPAKLLEAMVATSGKDGAGLEGFRAHGLVRADQEQESVSKTLEYAYDSWAIAVMARMLGREELYKTHIRRAQYYKNVFDPPTGFMRPKVWGKWLEPFDPAEVGNHFTEANSWQYSFYVPQDIETHIRMLGGEVAYIAKLDELFNTTARVSGREQPDITGLIGQYAHGNEPSHHAAYLYAYAGAHWKTQEVVHKILKTLYTSAPDGLCGNDDCGQMSAWYVLSSLGFYPVTPGSDTYVIGAPLFEKVVISLENGKHFTIRAPRRAQTEKMQYIRSAALNGTPYTRSWFAHPVIEAGGTLEFVLGAIPNYSYGTAPADRPVSRITDEPIVVNPFFEMATTVFKEPVSVRIVSPQGLPVYYVQVSGGEERMPAREAYTLYTAPFDVDESMWVYAYCRDSSGRESFPSVARFNKMNMDKKITLFSRYSPRYDAGGPEALVDGIRGSDNFRLGAWQGYSATNIEAVVDLGNIRILRSVGAGFHQDADHWIWMPAYVDFFVSEDGEHFEYAGRAINEVAREERKPQSRDLWVRGVNKKGRYVRMVAVHPGPNPEWHPGAGKMGMLFTDEILIDKE